MISYRFNPPRRFGRRGTSCRPQRAQSRHVSIRPGASGAGERWITGYTNGIDGFQSAPALRAPGNVFAAPPTALIDVSIRPGASGAGERSWPGIAVQRTLFQSAPALRAPGNTDHCKKRGLESCFNPPRRFGRRGTARTASRGSTQTRFNPPRRFGRRGTHGAAPGNAGAAVSIRPGASGAGEPNQAPPDVRHEVFQSAPALRAPGNQYQAYVAKPYASFNPPRRFGRRGTARV